MRTWKICAICLIAGATASCEREAETATTDVFRAKQFLTPTTQATKPTGANCDTFAQAECISGICLHWKSNDPNSGFVCSKRCVDSSDCDGPGNWECVQVYPAPNSSFCVPSEDNPIRSSSR